MVYFMDDAGIVFDQGTERCQLHQSVPTVRGLLTVLSIELRGSDQYVTVGQLETPW